MWKRRFHTSPCDAPPAYSPLPSRPRPQASLHNLNGPSLYAERTVGKIIYKKSAWSHESDKEYSDTHTNKSQRWHIEQQVCSSAVILRGSTRRSSSEIVLVIKSICVAQKWVTFWDSYTVKSQSIYYVRRKYPTRIRFSFSFGIYFDYVRNSLA